MLFFWLQFNTLSLAVSSKTASLFCLLSSCPYPPLSLHPASQFSLLFAFLHPLSHSPSSHFLLLPSYSFIPVYSCSVLYHFGFGGVCGLLSDTSLLCWQGGLVNFVDWVSHVLINITEFTVAAVKKHRMVPQLFKPCVLVGRYFFFLWSYKHTDFFLCLRLPCTCVCMFPLIFQMLLI